MGVLSDNIIATATSLLTRFGYSASFSRDTEGAYNPSTGDLEPGSTTSYSGKVYPFPFQNNEVDGTVLKRDDVKLLCNATSTAPAVDDLVSFGGQTYNVILVEKITIEGTEVAYQLGCRK